MVSPHIELASTVLECNLRSEAKMFFFSFSFLFFAVGRGGGYLSLVGLREWLCAGLSFCRASVSMAFLF